jgi:hypothetical protein
MTSNAKITANGRNSAHDTGPKSKTGKERSRFNARLHGIFARELAVDKAEEKDFQTVRKGVLEQLIPATPMRGIAIDRIICAIWRTRLATRFDAKFNTTFSEEQKTFESNVANERYPHGRWYSASNADLRGAIRLLSEVGQDIEANGWTNVDTWKPLLVRTFGDPFFSRLAEWQPMSITTIHCAEHLVEHAKLYNMPLPEDLVPDPKKDPRTADPRLTWQMAVKIIEQTAEFLEGLMRFNKPGSDALGQEQPASTVDLASRYLTSATRELERAVAFYQHLQETGL